MRQIMIWMILLSIVNPDFVTGQKNESQSAELAFEVKAELGEGAFWDARSQHLYWVDIEAQKVHIYDPEKNVNQSFELPSRVGTIVPRNKEEAAVALEDGIYILNIISRELELLVELEKELESTRFNDGKCDPNGNLWVGSMDLKTKSPIASLYKVTPRGETYRVLEDITISNGIVWSSDHRTMYYIDTPTGHIKAFDFDLESSTISNGRIAVDIDDSLGYPDGMTIDENNHLWVGMWQGEAVACFDPITGKLIRSIQVPALNVTSCAFGGDNLGTLYITTASVGMSEEEKIQFPLAGSVFKVIPGVRGVEGNYFGE